MTSFGHMSVRRRKTGEDAGEQKWEEYRVIQWKSSKAVMAKDRTRCLEPRTVNLSLKEVRELIEAGPKPTPQPGPIVPPKKANSKLVREPKADNGDRQVQLVSVGTDDDESEE
jgi:hypothetical protein